MDIVERCTELGKCGICRLGVREIGFYKQIDVFRSARLRMKRDGISAHDQVFNAMGMERAQKVFVVLEHSALKFRLSLRKQQA